MTNFLNSAWEKLTLTDDVAEFENYQSTWFLRFVRRTEEVFNFVLLKIPLINDAFTNPKSNKKFLKKILQFLFGILLGIFFYFAILEDLQLDPTSTAILGVTTCSLMGIGNAVSKQMRCLSLLLPLRLGSNTGRTVILALIIVYLSAGPITNIMLNLKECVRIIVCQMSMTFSLMKTKFEIMFKPLGRSFSMAVAKGDEANEMLSVVDEAIKPLQNEIESEHETNEMKNETDYIDSKWGESKRSDELEMRNRILDSDTPGKKVQKKYVKKLEYRCESMLSQTFTGCIKMFESGHQKCVQAVPSIISWICFPMKVTFVCNGFTLFGGDMCTANDVADSNMGALYETLQSSKENLKKDFLNQKFHYKVIEVPPDAKKTADDMYEASRKIVDAFKNKKSMIDVLMTIIMRCTAFSFIFIIIGYIMQKIRGAWTTFKIFKDTSCEKFEEYGQLSRSLAFNYIFNRAVKHYYLQVRKVCLHQKCNNYLYNYLNDVEADNRYVTMYFRKIDYRRYIKGKLTLIPFKLSEKRELSDVYEIRLTQDERGELVHALISTITLFFFSFLFISIDQFLYILLSDLREYGEIEYTQIGHHDLILQIKGIGFLASILRSIVSSFTVKRRIKRVITNKECLPVPNVPGQYNFKIFGSFFLLIILAVLNAWVFKRMNRYVCSIFFPRAEKKRIIHLYNEYLKKRITYLNFRLDIVKRDASKPIPDELTFTRVLRMKHERLFSWLKYFQGDRRKCLICQELEQKSGGEMHCTHIKCYAYYCEQCWTFVVKQQCIGCPRYREEPTIPAKN